MSEQDLSIKTVMEDPTTPASVLVVVVNDILTEDFLYYEVETIVDYLRDVYHIEVPVNNIDKIQTMQMVYTTNQFWMSLQAFMAAVDALNNHGVDFSNADVPSPEEVGWAVTEVLLNVPEADLNNLFHPDVQLFVQKVFEYHGVDSPPPSLKFLYNSEEVSGEGTLMEDEVILAAYSESQQDAKNSIEDYIGARMARVVHEVNVLPLKNRDSAAWEKFVKSVS